MVSDFICVQCKRSLLTPVDSIWRHCRQFIQVGKVFLLLPFPLFVLKVENYQVLLLHTVILSLRNTFWYSYTVEMYNINQISEQSQELYPKGFTSLAKCKNSTWTKSKKTWSTTLTSGWYIFKFLRIIIFLLQQYNSRAVHIQIRSTHISWCSVHNIIFPLKWKLFKLVWKLESLKVLRLRHATRHIIEYMNIWFLEQTFAFPH